MFGASESLRKEVDVCHSLNAESKYVMCLPERKCQVKERAIELAKAMENEDGVTGAVKAFFKHLPPRTPVQEPERPESSFLSFSKCFGCA